MGLFTRVEPRKEPAPPPKSPPDTHRSLALKALIEALSEERAYHVLDLGPAFGGNVRFLSQFASKIRIEDLYSTLVSAKFFGRPADTPVDESTFEKILSLPPGSRFDIILTWDLINYLGTEELRGLIGYLSRFCGPGTFLFAISSTLKEIPSSPIHFKILDSETLVYLTETSETIPCPRYVPRDLTLLLSGFRVHNSFLLRNGLQEYLFVRG